MARLYIVDKGNRIIKYITNDSNELINYPFKGMLRSEGENHTCNAFNPKNFEIIKEGEIVRAVSLEKKIQGILPQPGIVHRVIYISDDEREILSKRTVIRMYIIGNSFDKKLVITNNENISYGNYIGIIEAGAVKQKSDLEEFHSNGDIVYLCQINKRDIDYKFSSRYKVIMSREIDLENYKRFKDVLPERGVIEDKKNWEKNIK